MSDTSFYAKSAYAGTFLVEVDGQPIGRFHEVSGLSEAQATFRPAENAWNILEVLEHLIVVGPIYWNDLQKSLQAPPSKRSLATGDADILWYGIDRTRRETAIPPEQPPRRLRDMRKT